MKEKSNPRISLTASLVFFYLLPVSIFSWFAVQTASIETSWMILMIGIIGSVTCSLVMAFWLIYWEKTMFSKTSNQPVIYSNTNEATPVEENSHSSNNDSQIKELEQRINDIQILMDKQKQLIDTKDGEIQSLTQERYEVTRELDSFRRFAEEQLTEKEALRVDLERLTAELKGELDKKQSQSMQLESKIRDLSYEVKTLLQLADMNTNSSLSTNDLDYNIAPEVKPIGYAVQETPSKYIIAIDESENYTSPDRFLQSESDGSLQLKRCIDIAQKMTGAHYFAQGNRQGDFASDPYALDLRRLFDCLRSETLSVVFVYSQRENKLLFCNNHIRNVLGWTPEKFIMDFNSLVTSGLDSWRTALNQVNMKSEVICNMAFKSRDNHEQTLVCQLGNIPTGLFKGHVIGIMYAPVTSTQVT